MHVEPLIDKNDFGPAHREFLNWVNSFLPPDKFERFSQLMTTPLPTVEICENIFSALNRVFEGQNGYLKYEFSSPEMEADFAEYRQKLKDDTYWVNEAFEALKSAPHSVLIVDLPAEQQSELPEPYYYLLDISQVIDIEASSSREGCEYIIFNTAEGNIAVFDDAFYRVYKKHDNDRYELLSEVAHGLGYCPARILWDVPLRKGDTIQKRNPITNLLSKLDWFLFWEVSIAYYQTYGVFPITWVYEGNCDYRDEHGNNCEGGYVSYENPDGNRCQKECPACKKKTLIGAGTVLEVPAPSSKEDPDLRIPAGVIGVDVDSLEFNLKAQEKRKEDIRFSAIGRDIDDNGQAKNRDQVAGNFETKQDILINLKQSIENARRWTLDTTARLRYAANFLKGHLSYGDKFYLKSAEEMREEYAANKTAGMPMYALAASREQIEETRYRNNPDGRERARILAQLEPYADLTLKELAELNTAVPGLVEPEDLKLKTNFDAYIKRFEREQLPVQLAASVGVSFDTKINLIKTKLYEYVRENQSRTVERPSATAN